MIKSMTGFGKAEFEVNNKKVTIEIKSLNSKQIDINTRTPVLYREKDIIIRKAIAEKLVRGKVDFNIYVENLGDETNSKINEPILKGYFKHLEQISKDLKVGADHTTLHAAMRLPDVVKTEYETLDELEWETIYTNILAALDDINDFRQKEGQALEADIIGNVESINKLLKDVEPFEKQRIDALKVRLTDNLEALKLNGSVDQNRFEQELIFYLEKLDINEEKVRLANHCEYFFETAKQEGASGKKLGFISQEIGREINTIGSKANHSDIQRIVVQMKDHLERVKEQLLNVL
ncbi:YicC/YloC family endoribonuclease [uncultured Draconibacterium sp.]|uniref:YicC/YloC family endoribonuclease n=1 Tax=uncultured Draconibacterium sp. TaxID=1573823 RepID=UPI00325FEFFA